MRNILLIIVLALNALAGQCQNGSDKPTNVLFIAVDDLRPNTSTYGDSVAITPSMDKLASEGVLFGRAYCQVAVCGPSRSSILTGMYPDQIGVTDLVTHFRKNRPNLVTLPQIFKKNGFHSATIGKIFQGQKWAQDSVSVTRPPLLYQGIKKEQYILPENRTGKKATATEMIEVADTAYWDMYDRDKVCQLENRDRPIGAPELAFHNSNELRGYTDIGQGEISYEKEKKLWHGYYAATSFTDTQIGKVLKSLGMKDNTLIVLWGDHGYHLGEQGFWCKSSNYELNARVPLIFSHPKLPQDKQVSSIVELVDVYPTIIDVCDIQAQTPLSGRSLVGLMEGNTENWSNYAFNQFGRPYGAALHGEGLSHMGYSVRSDQFRLTLWFNTINDEIEERELYDMGEGIELENISGNAEYKKVEESLSTLLIDFRNQKYMVK